MFGRATEKVGVFEFAAGDFMNSFTIPQYRGPAARPRVAQTTAIGVDNDLGI